MNPVRFLGIVSTITGAALLVDQLTRTFPVYALVAVGVAAIVVGFAIFDEDRDRHRRARRLLRRAELNAIEPWWLPAYDYLYRKGTR